MAVPRTVAGQIGVLAGVCGSVFLAVVPWVVQRLGSSGVLVTLVAAGCCLLPGCLLFVLQRRFGQGSLVVGLLVGMASRVGCCLLGVGWLNGMWQVPLEPVLWVLTAFYLATLACETWVLSEASVLSSAAGGTGSLPQSGGMSDSASLGGERDTLGQEAR